MPLPYDFNSEVGTTRNNEEQVAFKKEEKLTRKLGCNFPTLQQHMKWIVKIYGTDINLQILFETVA